MKEFRILLVGGGSGGHVYPLIAVAESLVQKASQAGIDLKLMMLGGSFIERAAKEKRIPYRVIATGKLRRYSSLDNFLDPGRFFLGFMQSLWHIFWFMPDAIFAKGGASSLAAAFVAKLYFIPLFIHESDSVPGFANIILGKLADTIFISFKSAEERFNKKNIIFTGNPVRSSLVFGDKDVARQFFDLHEPKPTVLVLGGSQGAKVINEVILNSLVVMTQKFNVIHQCGEGQLESVKNGLDTILEEGARQYSESVKRYYRLYSFFDENQLSMAYAIADVVVSRAGAGSLFEIAQLGKPAIIIPIAQSAANHQYLNAFEFNLSGGLLMEEKNLNRESLMREIEFLINPENYAKVAIKIKSFAVPDAADKIASGIFKYLNI